MSVKVAVRVRPFNKREQELKSQLCVSMNGNSTTLIKPKDVSTNAKLQYTFDNSFWSFDNYTTEQDGYLKPKSSQYADQKAVFETLGRPLLDNAWQGYHCCLFAYGQTGSGKSYSMIGYGTNKGIVPISCEQMFKRLSGKKAGQDYQVTVSMIEIYNQKVQDLLVDIKKRPQGGLQIRENTILGVYVQNATKTFVSDYKSIQALMDQGSKNRTIAATQMNATSSRAHTIISITFTQHQQIAGKKTSKISVMNLVDLAGSERQSKTGATGDRLKQAAGINLSLTTLGTVISALAEKQDNKKKDFFIPYRNSALTRILQNALGGNSKTCMICAISPASDNFEESLSTLRYADQAKKIKNVAVVNETQTDKIIKGLKSQNQRLLALLQQKEKMLAQFISGGGNPSTQPVVSQQKKQQQQKTNLSKVINTTGDNITNYVAGQTKALNGIAVDLQRKVSQQSKMTKEQLLKEQQYVEQMIRNLALKSKQKLEQQRKTLNKLSEQSKDIYNNGKKEGALYMSRFGLKNLFQQKQKGSNKEFVIPPFLQNISKDIMTNRKIKIFLTKKQITVGKVGCYPLADIILSGRDVQPMHAKFIIQDKKVFLTPFNTKCLVYRNGKPVLSKIELIHLDRIVFGWNSLYLFKTIDDKNYNERIRERQIDWDFYRQEMKGEQDIDQSDTETGGDACCLMF